MANRVDEINLRLKRDGFRVAIVVRGVNDFLYLQATLPPKPESHRQKSHQQRIALGYQLSAVGLRQAETQARLLGTQLITKSFNWNEWLDDRLPSLSDRTGKESVEMYREWILKNKLQKYNDEQKRILWRDRYWNVGISQLNIDYPLSAQHFKAIAKRQNADTAQAKYVYREIRNFGIFCGIEGIEEIMSQFKSSYDQSKVKERVVPTDAEISELIPKILNPQWRYVFGMMATYGLRNHEVWSSHIEDRKVANTIIPVCIVREGKTGSRVAYPMPSEWVDDFDLRDQVLPNISNDLGKYTGRAWRRQCARISQKPEWKPYSLRHAYAIRCLTNSIPDAVASKWLGHSVGTFQNIYSKWINQSLSEEIWLRSAAPKASDNLVHDTASEEP